MLFQSVTSIYWKSFPFTEDLAYLFLMTTSLYIHDASAIIYLINPLLVDFQFFPIFSFINKLWSLTTFSFFVITFLE